jgi:hypothetical protein
MGKACGVGVWGVGYDEGGLILAGIMRGVDSSTFQALDLDSLGLRGSEFQRLSPQNRQGRYSQQLRHLCAALEMAISCIGYQRPPFGAGEGLGGTCLSGHGVECNGYTQANKKYNGVAQFAFVFAELIQFRLTEDLVGSLALPLGVYSMLTLASFSKKFK